MPDPTRPKIARPIRPLVPGRPVDMLFGGKDPDIEYLYDLAARLEENSAQIGTVDVPEGGFPEDSVLVFTGGMWTAVPRTALLELGDLSDVTITLASAGNFLVYDGSDWLNQNFSTGRLGLGTALDPAHRLELEDGVQAAWYTGTAFTSEAATAGWNISKDKADTSHAHGIVLRSDAAPCWDIRMAPDTDNAFRSGFGDSDLEIVDDSGDGGLSEIIARISPEEASGDAATAKFAFGKNAASPRSNTEFLLLDGGDDAVALGGQRIRFWDDGTTRHALALFNRHSTSDRTTIDFQGAFHLGNDREAAGVTAFALYDVAADKDRLLINSDGDILINEVFEERAQSGTEDSGATGRKLFWRDTLYDGGRDRMELLYNGELRVTLEHTNHPDSGIAHALQLFRRTAGTPVAGFGTGTQHFLEIDGGGGDVAFAGGTRVFWTDPTFGSESSSIELMYVETGVGKVGVRCTADGRVLLLDSLRLDIPKAPPASASQAQIQQGAGGFTGGAGHFASSANGTGIGQNWASGATADFYRAQVNGVTQFAVTSVGNMTALGDVTCKRLKMSEGLTGSGLPVRFLGNTITPASDADVTVSTPESDFGTQVLVTGAWTGPHDVILPASTFATYIIHNNGAHDATFRSSAGTGPTIAAGTRAIIQTLGGVNYVQVAA